MIDKLVERLVTHFPYHGFLQLIALESSTPTGAAPNERSLAAKRIMTRCGDVGMWGARAQGCDDTVLWVGWAAVDWLGCPCRLARHDQLGRVLRAVRHLCNAYTALGLQTAERQKGVRCMQMASAPTTPHPTGTQTHKNTGTQAHTHTRTHARTHTHAPLACLTTLYRLPVAPLSEQDPRVQACGRACA